MSFEIWLFGQTKDVQERYWHIFKSTKWATGTAIPKYSIIEVVVVDNPDFNNLDKLSKKIIGEFSRVAGEIETSLKELNIENVST